MTKSEYLQTIRNNIFAKRDTFDEAIEYAYMVGKAKGNEVAIMTAVMVVVNTICDEIERIDRQAPIC
jgi:hypothetical protein